MIKTDLHVHSNCSDGSDSISDLIENIKKSDIKIFSLTDHDTIEGVREIEKIIPSNVTFIKGVELTCQTEFFKCHILGFDYNPDDKGLNDLIKLGKELRRIKLEKRIDYLQDVWDIDLTQEELDWLYSRKSVVKTHFANILVNRKLADDNVSAMKKYLDACKTGNTKFDAKEAVNVLINAGAIPIWAHPLGGEGEVHLTKDEFKHRLEYMKSIGIQGFECFYSRYNKEEEQFLKQCAEENNMLISGGSDYHGTNKLNIQLGKLNTDNTPINVAELTVLDKLGIKQ